MAADNGAFGKLEVTLSGSRLDPAGNELPAMPTSQWGAGGAVVTGAAAILRVVPVVDFLTVVAACDAVVEPVALASTVVVSSVLSIVSSSPMVVTVSKVVLVALDALLPEREK
jgi:hypothetical protein